MTPEEYNLARDENRLMAVGMDPQLLTLFLNWGSDPKDVYCLPVSERIPEGARVLHVIYDQWDRTMHVVLCHISYEKCEPGERIPRYDPKEYVMYLRKVPSGLEKHSLS